MSSSDPGIPQKRDAPPNWAADTDPVGPVSPELALVDPGLTASGDNNEVTMSSMQFGDTHVPVEADQAAPVEPLQPLVSPPAPAAPAPVVPMQASAVTVGDMRDVPLGTLVFRVGLLPEERLEEALQEGMKTGKRLGEILLERGWVLESDLGRLLAGQKGLPFVELDASAIDPTAPALMAPEKARLHGALPIGFQGGVPVVAVADPSDDLVVENVRRALACEPVLVVAGRDALAAAIDHVYGSEASIWPTVEPVYEPAVEAAVEPVAVEPEVEPVVVEPSVPTVEPIAPAAPIAAEPVLPQAPVEPAQNGDGLWLGHPEQPVAPVLPVVAPPEPAPLAPQTAFAPAPTEPVADVAPEAAPPLPQPEAHASWAVVLRLTDGERLELGAFAGEAEAVERARAVVAQVASEDGWPFVEGRFIRPDAIVSIDLVELEVSRWLGSQMRAAAFAAEHQPIE